MERGRDWIATPSPERDGRSVRHPTLPAAIEIVCRDRGTNLKALRDGLAEAMSVPADAKDARISERLGK
ncbi:MAG: hypothetical protein LBQ79_11440, partial [Deltaproteobacteria bacterium]|nr:hypothetical protein [Deltaproteobacteria bacterium]